MNTPELDKQHAVIESGESETLTRFYDWMQESGYVIAEYREYDEYDDPRLTPVRRGPERLFADFFEIDLDKIDAEQRALLDELRGA